MVGLWPGGDPDADSDRRARCCHCGGIVCAAVRAKNLSDAAQHHAGRHLSTEGRRDRPANTVHPTRDISDRTDRCARHAAATFRKRDSAQFFGRRVDCSAVKTAATILTMYLALFFGGGVFISVYEDLPLSSCLYEAASAVGTVGLTLGITPQLHIPSQMVLIALMYLGRVGGLTLIYAAVSSKKIGSAKLPQESITIG